MEENGLIPSDYLTILNRRKWALIVPFILITTVAVLAALLIPSVYKSSATILVEHRAIPTEFVTSSKTIFAEHRIQSIKQRLLTSQHLQKLIDQFDLYIEGKSIAVSAAAAAIKIKGTIKAHFRLFRIVR